MVYSPAIGHELAASFYTGRYTPDFLPSETVNAFSVDGLGSWGAFELEGEYVYSDFGDIDKVAEAFAQIAINRSSSSPSSASPAFESEIEFELNGLAENRQGYWLEARYDTRPAWLRDSDFGRRFADPHLTWVARGEQVWINGLLNRLDFTDSTVTQLDKSNYRLDRFTVGASLRLVPNAALQLAYEYTQVDNGSLSAVTNYLATLDGTAHTLLLGTVFGF